MLLGQTGKGGSSFSLAFQPSISLLVKKFKQIHSKIAQVDVRFARRYFIQFGAILDV